MLLAPLALALFAGACGGAAPPSGGAKSVESDSLVTDLERSAEEMDTELARLERAVEGKKAETVAQPGQGEGAETPTTPAEPAAEEPAAPAATAPADVEQEAPSPRDRCRTACRALESMRRSAERICEIVGSDHDKCGWARARLEEARQRVDRAGCVCEK